MNDVSTPQSPSDDAFAAGVVAFADELRRFIRGRVRSAVDAEDIAQEVMLKVFRSRHTLRDPGKLGAWLFRTARSGIVDHFRRQRSNDQLDDTTPESDTPDFDQLGIRLQQSVKRFVAALPDSYREAVTLADLEDLPLATVAEQLGLSLTATKSRVSRGRELLRSRLFACCNFEVDRFGTAIDFQQRQPHCACDPTTAAPAAGPRPHPMPRVTIELASDADGPAITALLREAGLPTEDLHARSWLHFGVARVADRVVGAIGLEPHGNLALLRSLVVDPSLRGGGIGRKLVAEARHLGRQLGLKTLWLLTTTAETFFARAGFVPVDRDLAPEAIRNSAQFCALCPESAVVMRLSLAAVPAQSPPK